MSLETFGKIGVLLAVILLLIIGWETGFGTSVRKKPPKVELPAAQPLEVTLMPEFRPIDLVTMKATAERPLFTPTREPAPPAEETTEQGTPVERSDYLLTGTALVGETKLAFLKNIKDNKPLTVRVGDKVNGMDVTEVTEDRVKLSSGGREEEILLKVAAGPKGAVTPAAPPQGQQPMTPQQQRVLQQQQAAQQRAAQRAAQQAAQQGQQQKR
jgi:hypothetical protein